MAHLIGRVPAVPCAWPLPPRRGEAAEVGEAPGAGAAGRPPAPAAGPGHPTLVDVLEALSDADLVARR
eukprot:15455827-Alexandrium_andersonii.AAC.1